MDDIARLEQKLADYKPSINTVNLVQQTPVLLLAGISGAGKDAIKVELLKTGKYHRLVSHTTRAPRNENGHLEQHGLDYHFIDLAKAEAMIDRRDFVESKIYSGNVYGTSVAEIRLARRKGKAAIGDIEVQGVGEYVAIDPKIRVAFILPVNYETWQRRLTARNGGPLSEEVLAMRMQRALRELEHALGTTHMHFVVNHTLLEAAAEVDRMMHGKATSDQAGARRVAEEIHREIHKHHG